MDIVLNHTANNSKWIQDHPSATYNTDDCPHLWSAWLLDKGIQDFSARYAKGQVPECKSAPYISNEADLTAVLGYLKNKVITPLKLHEFFLSNVGTVIREEFLPAIQSMTAEQTETYKRKFEKNGWLLKPRF